MLEEAVVRMGAALPFAAAAEAVRFFTGTAVSEASVRRRTESAGAALAAWEAEEATRLEREAPEAEVAEGAVLQMSADGAMVGVVGGEWVEVKTLAIGVVSSREGADGAQEAVAERLSYFSRYAEAGSFVREALVETQRRGVERAERVVAVNDGAAWIQGLIDHHRPDAVRILDFPHAAESVAAVSKAAYGEGTPEAEAWFERQRSRLRHEEPDAVLRAIGRARTRAAGRGQEQGEAASAAHAYLAARREQITYAAFAASGYPLGSGAVESANKLLVERRLKGPGMHWARANLTPMLALRCASANGRWDEGWQRALAQADCTRSRHRAERAAARRAQPTAPASAIVAEPPPQLARDPEPPRAARPRTAPPATHPWKQVPFSRNERLRQADRAHRPKL
jgi:hypothetical protein